MTITTIIYRLDNLKLFAITYNGINILFHETAIIKCASSSWKKLKSYLSIGRLIVSLNDILQVGNFSSFRQVRDTII